MTQQQKKGPPHEPENASINSLEISNVARVYLETNVLTEAHWPQGSAKLRNLFLLCNYVRIGLYLLESAELETEQHCIRDFAKLISEFQTKLSMFPAGFRTGFMNDRRPDTDLVGMFRKDVEKNISRYKIERVPFTQSKLRDLFGLLIQHRPPFAGHSSGFQDSMILYSAFEHACSFKDSKISVIVTKDDGFLSSIANSGDERFVGMKIDPFISQLTAAFPSAEAETLQKWERETASASKVLSQMKEQIERFIASEYSNGFNRLLLSGRRLESVALHGISGVTTPIPNPADSTKERNVNISFVVEAEINSTTAETYTGTAIGATIYPSRIFVSDRTAIEIDATGTVENDEYKDIQLLSLEHRDVMGGYCQPA